jgi:Ca2+-binding RTX toxin-like protein
VTPPAATVMLKHAVKVAGRNLIIQGTKGSDTIAVSVNADDATKVDVTFNGVTKTVDARRVKRIMVNAKGGDDAVTIDAAVTLRAQVIGGAGNDSLTGGSGDDLLIDVEGTNQLTGGAGADRFVVKSADQVVDSDATQEDKVTVLGHGGGATEDGGGGDSAAT